MTLPSFALAAAVGARLEPQMLPPALSRRLAAVVEARVAGMRAEAAAGGDEARLTRSVEHVPKPAARQRGHLLAAASVVIRRLVGEH